MIAAVNPNQFRRAGEQACKGDREFPTPEIGVPNSVINRYVDTHYYVDLELMVSRENLSVTTGIS